MEMNAPVIKLSLGPIQYYWPRATVFGFYEAIARTAVDIVYLGELVCSRRHEMKLADWLSIADLLTSAGKEVVLSSLVLIESGADLVALRKIVENGRYAVEANDMGAVHFLENAHLPFVAGPHLNVYNAPTLTLLAGCGATRWVMPLEMDREGLAQILLQRPTEMETEVFVYGRMPLAFSARCFTARNRNLAKDHCEFSCLDYPDGLLMETREKQSFLILNGTQTQSAQVYQLLSELLPMQAMGVDIARISPQAQYTEHVVDIFDQVRSQEISADEGRRLLPGLMPDQPCDGYWFGKPGLALHQAAHDMITA
jgi:collagenase-like PrtC family protease